MCLTRSLFRTIIRSCPATMWYSRPTAPTPPSRALINSHLAASTTSAAFCRDHHKTSSTRKCSINPSGRNHEASHSVSAVPDGGHRLCSTSRHQRSGKAGRCRSAAVGPHHPDGLGSVRLVPRLRAAANARRKTGRSLGRWMHGRDLLRDLVPAHRLYRLQHQPDFAGRCLVSDGRFPGCGVSLCGSVHSPGLSGRPARPRFRDTRCRYDDRHGTRTPRRRAWPRR